MKNSKFQLTEKQILEVIGEIQYVGLNYYFDKNENKRMQIIMQVHNKEYILADLNPTNELNIKIYRAGIAKVLEDGKV